MLLLLQSKRLLVRLGLHWAGQAEQAFDLLLLWNLNAVACQALACGSPTSTKDACRQGRRQSQSV